MTFLRLFLPLLFLLFESAGAAVIATYRGDAPNLFNLDFPFQTDTAFDINADGVSDFRFFSDGHLVAGMRSFGANQFISTLSAGWDLGGELVSIGAGSIIGKDATSLPGDWHHHTDNRGSEFGLSAVQYTDGYLGVSFQAADGIHYGWIKYTGLGVAIFPGYDEYGNIVGYTQGVPIPGGLIESWAFESEPGKALIAGVVPEAKSFLLAMIGLAALITRRGREFSFQ